MSDRIIYSEEDEMRDIRRTQRRERIKAKRRRQRRRKLLIRRTVALLLGIGILVLLIMGLKYIVQKHYEKIGMQREGQVERNLSGDGDRNGSGQGTEADEESSQEAADMAEPAALAVGDAVFMAGFTAEADENTVTVEDDENMTSQYAVIIDESTNRIVAQKNADTVISPASMTKILTVLVAAEHVENLEDTVEITLDITDYVYIHDCSAVGFSVGEQVPVRDLFYGTVLPSGADAALALASYVAGSQEAFADMMNEKLKELGISDTAHFTNCIGLYDGEHYCTVYDMAMILKAAVENDFCREVLSARQYTTAATAEHPEGISISNWFLRRIEDKDTGGEVVCAKTGFVNQSGSCAASYGISDSGIPYICVTANTSSSWRCIYDHVTMYSTYAK